MAKRGIRAKSYEDLSAVNIRRVLTALEEGATKKVACEMLRISYNTTRLNNIIEEFDVEQARIADRKARNKGKMAQRHEIQRAITDYIEGDNITDIAKNLYRSSSFVKGIIDRVGVPRRPVGDEKASEVMLPDACIKEEFHEGEIAWSSKYHMPCVVGKEYTLEYQESMPGLGNINYEAKYGCKLYSIYCYNLYAYDESIKTIGWWSGRKKLGFSSHQLAHSLGSLEHLQQYGVTFE
jgi:hypothetical protein|tara:strand:- start:337 stop:1047 length:711 start_codon:yes stop_codon:yes gene_type:complete